jgi:hypothetical protein
MDYRGMSYDKASEEGLRLLKEAVRTGKWFGLPEKLAALRAVMWQRIAEKGDLA